MFFILLPVLFNVCFGGKMKDVKIWPYPKDFSSSSTGSSFDFSEVNFRLYDVKTGQYVPVGEDPLINDCIERYEPFMLQIPLEMNQLKGKGTLDVLIKVDVSERTLKYGFNESYRMQIQEDGNVEIEADSIFAVVRAMETLTQLCVYRTISNLPISISDAPRYKWRGMLIDVNNHYLHLDTLKRILDAMSYHKLNTLHLHLIDSSSFPLQVEAYPLLSEMGAYSNKYAIFTVADMKELADHAYLRGIRIVPEFEAPGHGYSWGKGYPQVTAKCPSYKDIQEIPLNPIEPLTTNISHAILDELISLFQDDYYHFGGDEVSWGCWTEDKSINDYLIKHDLTPQDLSRLFMMDNIYKYVPSKIPIHWQERIEEKSTYPIPQNSIVQIWKDPSDLTDIVKLGYPVINSGGWYLDRMQPVPPKIHYAMLDSWRDMYSLEMDDYVAEADRHLIMGGEIAMWSEQINDVVVDIRMWPKGSAPSERLWSPKDIVIDDKEYNDPADTDLVTRRLMFHICHNLIQRNINASPIQPDYCPRVKH